MATRSRRASVETEPETEALEVEAVEAVEAVPAPEPYLPGQLTPEDLAAFLGATHAGYDPERFGAVLESAHRAIEGFANRRLPVVLEHDYRQAVLLTAAKLVYSGAPTDPPLEGAAIPATARYYAMKAAG